MSDAHENAHEEYDGHYLDLVSTRDRVRKNAWRLVQMRYYHHTAEQDPAMPVEFDCAEVNAECIQIAVNFEETLDLYTFPDDLTEEDEEEEKTKTHKWE